MNAIRRDEHLDNLHSIYVDQWDWEKVIEREDRNIEFLEGTVDRIMKAIIEKVTSPAIIVHFDTLLESLKGTFLTNITSDSLYAFCRKQLEENIHWNIVNYHVLGEVDMNEVATSPGQALSIVYPYSNHVEFVSQVIQNILDGEEVSQEEMPEGEYDDQFYQTFFGYNPYAQQTPQYEEPVYEEPQSYEEPIEEAPAAEEEAPVQETESAPEESSGEGDINGKD